MFKDIVRVADQGIVKLRNKGTALVQRAWFGPSEEKSVVEVKGWVTAMLRERGKIVPGSHRSGKNIWTNTGREYLAMLMSLSAPATPYRSDRMAYIGVGTGSTIEDVNVTRLVTPVEFQNGQFLAPLEIPPTFPLTPTRTTVRYHIVFAEDQISLPPGGLQVNISELGLFTSGSPTAIPPYSSRPTGIADAGSQAPNAYKAIEPLGKTSALELEVSWEIRF